MSSVPGSLERLPSANPFPLSDESRGTESIRCVTLLKGIALMAQPQHERPQVMLRSSAFYR